MSAIKFERTLTKTSFARGCQCKKQLWLHRFEPQKNVQQTRQIKTFIKIDNPLLHIAYQLFPKGRECSTYQLEEEKDWNSSLKTTSAAIANGESVLYNPTFKSGDVLCDIHLLVKDDSDNWKAYIIKSTTRVSDRNVLNAAYQFNVIHRAGVDIKEIHFITINNSYVRKGKVEEKKLFKQTNITKRVLEMQSYVDDEIKSQLQTLQQKEAPKQEIGVHCTEPITCNYQFKCWNPTENSIFELVGFSKQGMFDLWKKGFDTIDKIPEYQDLSWHQSLQKAGKVHINKGGIESFLRQISHPLMLVDFEGFVPAIPQFDQSKPFEIIPFLFAGITLSHVDDEPHSFHHICPTDQDPRRSFTEEFIQQQKTVKTILVYDPHTEKTILKSLGKLFPDLAEDLKLAREKIIDLSLPIRKKDYYLPAMKGFHSMKYALPAIAPELKYNNLDIQNGRMAATTYQMLRGEKDDSVIEETLGHLVEYCSRDTIGLLKIYHALLEAVK